MSKTKFSALKWHTGEGQTQGQVTTKQCAKYKTRQTLGVLRGGPNLGGQFFLEEMKPQQWRNRGKGRGRMGAV